MTERKHGRHCYALGCRCEIAKQANREYAQKRRAERNAKNFPAKPLRLVPAIVELNSPTPTVDTEKYSPVERPTSGVAAAVLAEVGASEQDRPGMVALAVHLAGLIDNGGAAAVDKAPQLAAQIGKILTELRPKVDAVAAGPSAQELFLTALAAPL